MAGCVSTGSQATAGEPVASSQGTEQAMLAAFLVVDGVYNTELIAPMDVFDHTRYHDPQGLGIQVVTVSPDGQPITTAEGLRISPDYSFANAPKADILVVASAEGSRDRDLENLALIDWVRRTGSEARYVMSLCWGAFVLAEAGLLDEHACTTFPSDYGRFAQTFPELDLRFNVSFVHDRQRLTSQGGIRSFEAAMYLVDLLFGEEVATGVGSGLLITWPPPPGQRPEIVSGPVTPPAGR